MAVEIAPGVYWLAASRSNLYLCVDGDRLALVDAGMPRQADVVWRLMADLGRPPAALRTILITHADLDHAGSVAALQQRSGATVVAGRETAAWLARGQSPPHMPAPVQFVLDRFVRFRPVAGPAVREVTDGESLSLLGGIQALATPGHTMDHVSYFLPAHGLLFAGDALNTRGGRLQVTPPRISADVPASRRSAINLLALAPAVFACGHGPPLSGHSTDDLMALFNTLRQP